MRIVKKVLMGLFKSILALLALIFLYLLISYLFIFFPKKSTLTFKNEHQIYVLYNDMHSDIVLNIKEFNLSKFPQFKKYKQGYLSFGWGDKETYLNTPTWNEIKASTTLKALFLNTDSLMHITYYSSLEQFKELKSISFSKESLMKLEENIVDSFDFKENKYFRGYGRYDLFYPAKDKYNLFNTCNCWTGTQLRRVGVPMSYWTPLSQNVTATLP